MEIFQIPRILIYEDKCQLSDYEVEDNRSINFLLYNFLNQIFSSIQDKTSLFNDAYYICTLILMDDSPHKHFDEFSEIAAGSGDNKDIHKDAVLCLAFKYLTSIVSSQDAKLRQLTETMELELSFSALLALHELDHIQLPDSMFAPRKITKELLQSVNLRELTKGYSIEVVLQLTTLLAKNTVDKMIILDAVIRSAENEMDSEKEKSLVRLFRMLKVQLTDPAYNSAREDEKSTEQKMEMAVRDVNEKMGEATVPLSVLVDGIKKRALIKGVDTATELFDHLNSILYDIPEWRKNVPELEKFFADKKNEGNISQRIFEALKDQTEAFMKVADKPTNQFTVYPQSGSTANLGCQMQSPEFKVIPLSKEQQPALESRSATKGDACQSKNKEGDENV